MLRRRRSWTRVEVEDELETVAEKTAITRSFLLAFGAESSSFNRQVKRGRQRLNEFGTLRNCSPTTRLSGEGAKLV